MKTLRGQILVSRTDDDPPRLPLCVYIQDDPRVYRHYTHMCLQMWTCCPYTRNVLNLHTEVFSACHTIHHTTPQPHTTTTTTQQRQRPQQPHQPHDTRHTTHDNDDEDDDTQPITLRPNVLQHVKNPPDPNTARIDRWLFLDTLMVVHGRFLSWWIDMSGYPLNDRERP